ncbi:4108_t:CDS:2, partial [Scutellospora calospora]
MFAPRIEKNETIDSYMDLIYRPLLQDNILENVEDDDDSSSISRGRGRGRARGRVRGRGRASTENLTQNVCAAIYLSLDKLWEVPNELSLIATILDPRMKSFPFINDSD